MGAKNTPEYTSRYPYFQNFLGEAPHSPVEKGDGARLQHPTPQERSYRDEIVLRLLYNFLLLLFFNLKNPVKIPLILALSAYNSNTTSVTPIFYYEIVISMKRCNFLQSLKKIL